MNEQEKEALAKLLSVVMSRLELQTKEQNELLRKCLTELEKISANTGYLAQTYVAPS
jgi:hypothetical protein